MLRRSKKGAPARAALPACSAPEGRRLHNPLAARSAHAAGLGAAGCRAAGRAALPQVAEQRAGATGRVFAFKFSPIIRKRDPMLSVTKLARSCQIWGPNYARLLRESRKTGKSLFYFFCLLGAGHQGVVATKVGYFGVKSAKVYPGTDGHLTC